MYKGNFKVEYELSPYTSKIKVKKIIKLIRYGYDGTRSIRSQKYYEVKI